MELYLRRIDELPPDRDERILLALRSLGVSGQLGRVARAGRGKPYLPDRPDLCFSVSHSGALWVCALADRPVGVDLQRHTDCPRERIARRFFHPDEIGYLEAHGFRPFFDVWTARESYVKGRGTGLFGERTPFSVVRDGCIAAPEGWRFVFPEPPVGFSLTAALFDSGAPLSNILYENVNKMQNIR